MIHKIKSCLASLVKWILEGCLAHYLPIGYLFWVHSQVKHPGLGNGSGMNPISLTSESFHLIEHLVLSKQNSSLPRKLLVQRSNYSSRGDTPSAMSPGLSEVNNRWPVHWGIYFSPFQKADGNFNPLTSDLSLEPSFFPSKKQKLNLRLVKSFPSYAISAQQKLKNYMMSHGSDLPPQYR